MRAVDGDSYELESGKELFSNLGIVGISPHKITRIFGGYDMGEDADNYTPEERAEIADYMIALWTKWKEQP